MFHGARHIYGTPESDTFELKHDDFEGRVSYEGKYASFGAISGPMFSGVLEIDNTTIRCTFVVRRSSMAETTQLGMRTVDVTGNYRSASRFQNYVAGDGSVN